jgi:putative transcriptional regulator
MKAFKPAHHLDDATLLSYSAGALSSAMTHVAAAHIESCQHCRDTLRDADQIGGALLQQQRPMAATPSARDAMLVLLETDQPKSEAVVDDVMPAFDADRLPTSLHPWFGQSIRALRWRRVAPGVQRIRAKGVSGGELMLLRTAPGSRMPLHSHGGNELTMILQGSYDDVLGHFAPGDVADLDGETEHQPVTSAGVPCICVAATDAPLVFSNWLARSLQPVFGF